MKVQVRFFSFLKQKVGNRENDFDLPSDSTLEKLFHHLFTHTGLTCGDLLRDGGIRKNLIVLVNGKSITGLSHKLSEGDEVSLMPSIGGG